MKSINYVEEKRGHINRIISYYDNCSYINKQMLKYFPLLEQFVKCT